MSPLTGYLVLPAVEFVANDCGASIVIASHEKALALKSVKENSQVREVIAFGDDAPDGMQSFNDLLATGGDAFQIPEIDLDSLSTIGYTSGTTGHPKGSAAMCRSSALDA